MTNRFLLDTDFCVAWTRGYREARLRVTESNWQEFAICSVVRGELRTGYWKGDREESRQRLDWFLEAFPSLPYDDAAADVYGRLRALLERQGSMIGQSDLMIASIAIVKGMTVVTRNVREFRRVPGLQVEEW